MSSSDAHSPARIAREACVFDTDLSYYSLRKAIQTGRGFLGTLEFFPEEGKYHLDGHRQCRARLQPEETKALHGLCPVCKKPVTVGVLHRVTELADRPPGKQRRGAKPFRSLVPLSEVLSEILQVGPQSRRVQGVLDQLLRKIGPELFVLDEAPLADVRRDGSALLAEGINRLRRSAVTREPGYDGDFGVIRLFADKELKVSRGMDDISSYRGASSQPAGIQLDVADLDPFPGIGDMDLSVRPLDDRRVGELARLILQSQNHRPFPAIRREGHIQWGAAFGGVIANQQLASVLEGDGGRPGIGVRQIRQNKWCPGLALIFRPSFPEAALLAPPQGLQFSTRMRQDTGLDAPALTPAHKRCFALQSPLSYHEIGNWETQ